MKTGIALAITLGIGAALPAFAAPTEPPHHHHHYYHHHRRHAGARAPETAEHPGPATIFRAPAPEQPIIAPYPPGQGDTDGLSQDPDDCNKGCVGAN